ncbi:NucA/NucB deoxyribonuclease domain-containing protein [Kribbella sp. NPDC055110]
MAAGALLFVSASIASASTTSAGAEQAPRQASASVVTAPQPVALAPPKPVPSMKKLPAGATAEDFQRAMNAYAAQTVQSYNVDASSVDPATAGNSKFAAASEPDVPDIFTYLTVDQCRRLGQGSYWAWQSNNGPGRIYNHYQWCTWTEVDLYKYETINNKTYETGKVSYRLTVIGWGSKSTNEVVVRIYVDQAHSPERSKVTPGTTTLIARLSCDFVYGHEGDGASCGSQPSSSQDAILADLDAGQMLEFKTTVPLPTETTDNPDRKTGLNLRVKFEATNPANPGAIANLGTLQTVVRCDGSQRSDFTPSACIFAGVVPTWSLSKADPVVDEVAKHIYDALNNPNSTAPPPNPPGSNKIIPYNLTRTVDGNLNKAQRDRAVYQCSKWFPKQSDESCDEYPFASTYEGTFNDPETNYSVKYITAKKNTDEGRLRGTWYHYDRILEMDGFRVFVY